MATDGGPGKGSRSSTKDEDRGAVIVRLTGQELLET